MAKDKTGNTDARSYVQVTCQDVTLTVLKLLSSGMYAKQIADKLGRSKPTIHRHIQKLIKSGLLNEDVRTFSKIYSVSEKGETAIRDKKLPRNSYISTEFMRLGAHMRIYIPVLKRGHIPESFWDTINDQFNNSVIKHKDLKKYIEGVSVRETTKGIELSIKHRRVSALKDIIPLVTNSVFWAIGFFSGHGYVLDNLNYRVNDTHNTIWTEKAEDVAKESGRVTVVFPRNRTKITPRDKDQPEKAWTDGTPAPGGLETNSIHYAEAFIRQPIRMENIDANLERLVHETAAYAKAQNAHIPVLNGMEKLLVKLDDRASRGDLDNGFQTGQPDYLGKIETAITKMADVLARLDGRDNEDPLDPGIVRDTDLVEVTFTEDTKSFMGILRENEIAYEPKKKGKSMILERLTADMLVSNGKAEITSDSKGARG